MEDKIAKLEVHNLEFKRLLALAIESKNNFSVMILTKKINSVNTVISILKVS